MNHEIGLEIKNLIIVPGHFCLKEEIKETPKDLYDETNYILLPYQKGEVRFYLEHIGTGIKLAEEDKKSLLVFSGGFTRKGCGQWSEALTYLTIANINCQKCDNKDCNVSQRIALDELALDSFQNLEHSESLFIDLVGKKPDHTTVVGWKFKEERFDLHRETLGIQKSEFEYAGVNNPPNLEDAMKGEKKTIELFKKNPLGNNGELLFKRRERNVTFITC